MNTVELLVFRTYVYREKLLNTVHTAEFSGVVGGCRRCRGADKVGRLENSVADDQDAQSWNFAEKADGTDLLYCENGEISSFNSIVSTGRLFTILQY